MTTRSLHLLSSSRASTSTGRSFPAKGRERGTVSPPALNFAPEAQTSPFHWSPETYELLTQRHHDLLKNAAISTWAAFAAEVQASRFGGPTTTPVYWMNRLASLANGEASKLPYLEVPDTGALLALALATSTRHALDISSIALIRSEDRGRATVHRDVFRAMDIGVKASISFSHLAQLVLRNEILVALLHIPRTGVDVSLRRTDACELNDLPICFW